MYVYILYNKQEGNYIEICGVFSSRNEAFKHKTRCQGYAPQLKWEVKPFILNVFAGNFGKGEK